MIVDPTLEPMLTFREIHAGLGSTEQASGNGRAKLDQPNGSMRGLARIYVVKFGERPWVLRD